METNVTIAIHGPEDALKDVEDMGPPEAIHVFSSPDEARAWMHRNYDLFDRQGKVVIFL